MKKGTFTILLVLICSLAKMAYGASGQVAWFRNGIAVCDQVGSQRYSQIISDKHGGTIVLWENCVTLGDTNIYAQRLNKSGNLLWGREGIVVCAAPGEQTKPQLIFDGSDGAIIVWEDARNGNLDIYAQRISRDGDKLWQENGVPVCKASDYQSQLRLVTDGNGGAIIAWEDCREGAADIYAQAVDSNGKIRWQKDGVIVSEADSKQLKPQIISDGQGGVIICWHDYRSLYSSDIYAQKLDKLGSPQWHGVNGIVICNATSFQVDPKLVSNGNGGAIVAWADIREGKQYHVFAQLINSKGDLLWENNGNRVCDIASYQYAPEIATDGKQGAIIVWLDDRNETFHIYTQRIDNSGSIMFPPEGVLVSTRAGKQINSKIVADGEGGAVIAWQVIKGTVENASRVFVQKMSRNGSIKWRQQGVPVCLANGKQIEPHLVLDGQGGAVVIWDDIRKGYYDYNVFIQRIEI